jgi:hypothetical protein
LKGFLLRSYSPFPGHLDFPSSHVPISLILAELTSSVKDDIDTIAVVSSSFNNLQGPLGPTSISERDSGDDYQMIQRRDDG